MIFASGTLLPFGAIYSFRVPNGYKGFVFNVNCSCIVGWYNYGYRGVANVINSGRAITVRGDSRFWQKDGKLYFAGYGSCFCTIISLSAISKEEREDLISFVESEDEINKDSGYTFVSGT